MKLRRLTGAEIRNDIAAATRLQRSVELVLERLTARRCVEMRFKWQGSALHEKLTQEKLLELVPGIELELGKAILGACDAARVSIDQVDHVMLAGIMMRLKPLQRIVELLVPHAKSLSLLEKNELARGAAIQARSLTEPNGPPKQSYHASSCAVYDFAIPVQSNDQTRLNPRVLVERGSGLPVSVARRFRFNDAEPEELFLMERSRLGQDIWHRLGTLSLSSAFPHRLEGEPLSLSMNVDASGLLRAELIREATKERVPFPHVGSHLSETKIDEWREWLETMMLCSS